MIKRSAAQVLRRLLNRKPDWPLIGVSLAIATGIALIGYAFSKATPADEVLKLPPGVEAIAPVNQATQVPSQTVLFVDLEDHYTGFLTIDDVTYPTHEAVDAQPAVGEQVDVPAGVSFDEGTNVLTFRFGDQIDLKEFSPGSHVATVTYWNIVEGRDASERRYTWTFTVV